MDSTNQTKQLLSALDRIGLYGHVMGQVTEAVGLLTEERFPTDKEVADQEFVRRITEYESITQDLRATAALLAFWGSKEDQAALVLPARYLGGRIEVKGYSSWLTHLRWYPISLLLYCGGIAAIAGNKYQNLKSLLHTRVSSPEVSFRPTDLMGAVAENMVEANTGFKTLLNMEKMHTPRSEYLFGLLRPELDQLLFLGPDYEWCFDQFEVLFALECFNHYHSQSWGWRLHGRFVWKYQATKDTDPFHHILQSANSSGASWPPIKAGLFNGNIDRFNEIVEEYKKHLNQVSVYPGSWQ
jgi:hypothetical protein